MKKDLAELLKKNVDLFAWAPNDMPKTTPEVIFHKLVLDLKVKPIA